VRKAPGFSPTRNRDPSFHGGFQTLIFFISSDGQTAQPA